MQPFFLSGETGGIFCLYFSPAAEASRTKTAQEGILCFAPFGEEMNLSRTFVAQQARLFARQGYHVLLADPTGTGDSAGEFVDSLPAHWLADYRTASRYLIRHCGLQKLHVWGIRYGAIPAVTMAAETGAAAGKCILWSPVTRGRDVIRQLKRQYKASRLAAAFRHEPDWDTSLAQTGYVDVGGYGLTPAMLEQLTAQTLNLSDLAAPEHVLLFRHSQMRHSSLRLRPEFQCHVWEGPQFWAVPEQYFVPALSELTLQALSDEQETDNQATKVTATSAPSTA